MSLNRYALGFLLLAAACGSEPPPDTGPVVGRACDSTTVCGNGYTCYTQATGGYCLVADPSGVMASCTADGPSCPIGSVCSPLPGHQIAGICMRSCDSAAECRDGLVCSVVELFPGDVTSPRSPHAVCWASCTYLADQTCNDNPAINSLHGKCNSDGTCTCSDGVAKNPSTGRCL